MERSFETSQEEGEDSLHFCNNCSYENKNKEINSKNKMSEILLENDYLIKYQSNTQ